MLENVPHRVDGLYTRELDRVFKNETIGVAAALGLPTMAVSQTAGRKNEHDRISLVVQVLSLVSAAFEPLHKDALLALLDCTPAELEDTLDLVPSIIVLTNDGRVCFFHKSGRDFLIREGVSNGSDT
eukprot:10017317-Ditylum_brightwellii.AAC.1